MTPRVLQRRSRRPNLPLLVIILVLAALVLPLTAVGPGGASASTSVGRPAVCNSSFNAYTASARLRAACGVEAFPLQQARALPDGGTEYVYTVEGARTVYDIPPAGFDATLATPAQQRLYGLPASPPAKYRRSGAEWHDYLKHVHFIKPAPVIYAVPKVAAYTSGNWGGVIESGHTYTDTTAGWYEPGIFGGNCDTSQTSVVFWVGLGGWNGDKHLAQDGTGENVAGLGQNQYWSEVLPQQTHLIPENGTAPVGSQVMADTNYAGSNTFYFTLQNYTNYDYLYFHVTADGFSGATAEQIAERPSFYGTPTPLTNFHNILFTAPYANFYGDNGYCTIIGCVPHGAVTMVTSRQLTHDSPLDSANNDNFYVYQDWCR